MSEPTVICVLGMHRSGTSLVAHLLYALGLDLGPREHLMRPSSANPVGHWENEPIKEMNDEILSRLGGSWSDPPELPAGWEESPELDELRHQARDLIETDFASADRWAFKDPRISLTLPFWQRILPPMRYVICLRNPVDVAFSLQARDEEPLPFDQGVELWLRYVGAALAATAGHPQEIVLYEDLVVDPEPVVRRLARLTEKEPADVDDATVKAAIRVAVSEELSHHRTPVSNVVDEPRLAFPVKALYMALRLFTPGAESVGTDSLDLLAAYAADAGRKRADLERRLAERRSDVDRLVQERAEEARTRQRVEADLEATRSAMHAGQRSVRDLEEQLRRASAELEESQEQADPPPSSSAAGESKRTRTAASKGYGELVEEVKVRAQDLIPSGATVLVASKGDDALVQLDGRQAWHFPTAPDGRYGGYHPASDTAVVAQLEASRARGADHLLLPASTMWWLDHYEGFRRHLEGRYVRVLEDERCVIYRLRAGDSAHADGPLSTLKRAVAGLRARSGEDPSVLDWHTKLEIADHFPELPVFAPPGEETELPYLEGTVDVVVLDSADDRRLAEARRVASNAVIRIDAAYPDVAELEWLAQAPTVWGGDVSVTLVPDEREEAWEATLTAFAEMLDDQFSGELILVGDTAKLRGASARALATGVAVRQVEAQPGASLAQRARAATEEGSGQINVFVTAPAVPLPDWLPSILELFSSDRDAGIVGGMTLSRNGALEEAGGILAVDGSRHRRGEGDTDPDRPEYGFVRRVDFCSAPLIATRRDVFERLGGFEGDAAEPTDALASFSLRAGQAGVPVFYQPQTRVVKIGDES